MQTYRLYPLNRQGRIVGAATLIEGESDKEAIQQARSDEKLHGIELWRGSKLIYRTEGTV
jgi:hypothetical protein